MTALTELLMSQLPFLSQGWCHALTGCALGGLSVGCLVMGLRDPDLLFAVDECRELDQIERAIEIKGE